MQGFNPLTREPIRPAGSNGTRVAGIDLIWPRRRQSRRCGRRPPPSGARRSRLAHRKAVESTSERTEREVALVRRKDQRRTSDFEKAKGLLATEVVHTTSRLAKGPGRARDPRPAAALPRRRARRRTQGRQARRRRIQAALPIRPRERRLVPRRACGEPPGARGRHRTAHGQRRTLLRACRASQRSCRQLLVQHAPQDVHRAANLFRQRYGREPRPGELGSLTTTTRGSKTAAGGRRQRGVASAAAPSDDQTPSAPRKPSTTAAITTTPTSISRKELLDGGHQRTLDDHRARTAAPRPTSSAPASAARPRPTSSSTSSRAPASCCSSRTARGRRASYRELEQQTLAIAERRASEIAAPVSERSLKQAQREIGKQIKGSLTQEQRDALRTITGPGGIAVLVGPRRHRQGRRDLRRREGVAAGGQRGDRHRDRRRDRANDSRTRRASTAPTPPTDSSTGSRRAASGSGRTPSSSWTRPRWPTTDRSPRS